MTEQLKASTVSKLLLNSAFKPALSPKYFSVQNRLVDRLAIAELLSSPLVRAALEAVVVKQLSSRKQCINVNNLRTKTVALQKINDFDPNYKEVFGNNDIKGKSVYTEQTDKKVGTINDALWAARNRFLD